MRPEIHLFKCRRRRRVEVDARFSGTHLFKCRVEVDARFSGTLGIKVCVGSDF